MLKSIASTFLLTMTTLAVNAAPLDADVITKQAFASKTGIFDVEAMMACGRMAAPEVSADGQRVLFGITYQSVEQNKSNLDLYSCNIDGTDLRRLTATPRSEQQYAWLNANNDIIFIGMVAPDDDSDKSPVPQLCVIDQYGQNMRVLTNIEQGVYGFKLSPDQKHIVIIGNVKYARTPQDIYPDLPKANAHIVDDLMYKHWAEWVTEIPHPFVGEFDGTQVTNLVDVMEGEAFESPMKPFGGVESFAWTPDSKGLIYVSRKKTGVDYALSTNSDLYLYDLAHKTTRNLTEGMMGYDTAPAFSPDGRTLAWLSMERDGYEADKNRLFAMDWATGAKRDLTADWDYTIEQFAWAPDNKSLYFIAYKDGSAPIFNIDAANGRVTVVDQGPYDYAAVVPTSKGSLIAMRHSMTAPDELFVIGPRNKKTKDAIAQQFTHVNADVLDQVTMPTTKAVMVPTTDGKQMMMWVAFPPNFDPEKKYPALLFCEGGPQSAVSQFWSYRWNISVMASQGYIVLLPNRRGVPGFGTEWEEQISGDYPGQNMRDYLSAVDWATVDGGIPQIDPKRVGCVGASYGGFSVYWLAGNHNKRFAAFLAHAGIFNTVAQYLETEEMWFANWDMGGAFWERENAVAQRTHAASPHEFVDKWDTPIMVTHGEQDFRILASQGMMAFNAAKLRGIPAEMVIFPDECHWILQPQNAVLWYRLYFRWFDRWLKDRK